MRLRRVMLFVLGAVVLAVAIAVVAALSVDLRAMAVRRATAALGREVTIGALDVRLGNPLVITAEDVRLANAPWGKAKDMASLGRAEAALELWPLLRGAVIARRLVLDKPVVALERDAQGAGNWQMAAIHHSPGQDGAPHDASGQRIVVLDLQLREGALSIGTSSGNTLRVGVADARFVAADLDSPVDIRVEGSYNGAPVTFTGTSEPPARLRDPSHPYGVDVRAVSGPTEASFKGTLTDPLDADGVDGRLDMTTSDMGATIALLGGDVPAPLPARIGGHLTRNGDAWRLEGAQGSIAGSDFTGALALDEGARGRPDRIGLTFAFATLLLDPLIDKVGTDSKTPNAPRPLGAKTEPDALLDARLTATRVMRNGVASDDVAARLEVAAGRVELSEVRAGVAGGRLDGFARIEAVEKGGRLTASVGVAAADIGQVLRLAGTDFSGISGRIDGRLNLRMTGPTFAAALGDSLAQGVIAARQGAVERRLIELASANLRTLFRRRPGTTPLVCFLTVLDMENGLVTVAPLRLRTGDGTLIGGGRVDLRRSTLDFTMQTESSTTDFFALDVPVRITGALSDPSVRPALRADANGLASEGAIAIRQLPMALRPLAGDSPCLR